jgi:predicted glycoside hydrolase/deacetylase ChbG (UPF0249 family)
MKRLFFLLFLYLLFNASFAQQAPRLLVRGDDMGYTHSGNEALIICYQQGIEKCIEVLVPSHWFPEAVKLLKQNPGIDVGIHLDPVMKTFAKTGRASWMYLPVIR